MHKEVRVLTSLCGIFMGKGDILKIQRWEVQRWQGFARSLKEMQNCIDKAGKDIGLSINETYYGRIHAIENMVKEIITIRQKIKEDASSMNNSQDIFPTMFGRKDGKITAIKLSSGWVLRCIRGPAWFWNHTTNTWDISCISGFRSDEHKYVMTQDEALSILKTLIPVDG